MKDDFPVLKENHKYYCQVQGQMGITGAKWWEFVTYTFRGMIIEPIYFFTAIFKLEQFFFKHFAKFFKALPVPAETCSASAAGTVNVTATSLSSISGN